MEQNNKASSDKSEASKSSSLSFGKQLQEARKKKGLSTEKVAHELFILERHIKAIEEENFDELPQATFARGFVINYAKLLDLDADSIAGSFSRAYPTEMKKTSANDIESPLRPMGTLQREEGRPWKINPMLIVGVIALIILAVFLLRTVANAQSSSESEEKAAMVVDDVSVSDQAAGAAVNIPESTTVTTATPALSNEVKSNEAKPEGAAADNDTTNVVKEEATLEFWVKASTDVTVVDANGKSLLAGNQPRGGYNLSGVAPFKIQIGKVSNVTLNLNKEPVALKKFAQDNKADFTLTP